MFLVQTHNSFSTACLQSEKEKKKSHTDSFTSEPTSHSAEPGVQDFKRSLLAFRHQKPHSAGLLPAARWTLWAFRWTVSPSAGARQPTAGGGMLWLPLPPRGLRAGATACCSSLPTDSPRCPSQHRNHQDQPDTQIVTSRQTRPACVCFPVVCVAIRPMSEAGPPCLSVCTSSLSHT